MQENEEFEKSFEQMEATNKLLLEMNKNQKKNNKNLLTVFIVVVACYTLILMTMVIGFFVYESQYETSEDITETTITQEVSGEGSNINNVEGNQYNDNAIHNE